MYENSPRWTSSSRALGVGAFRSAEREATLERFLSKEVASVYRRRLLVFPALSALALAVLLVHAATAQSATGTISGRVVWGPCIRGIPLPAAPDAQGAPGQAMPDSGQPQIQPMPIPASGLPAGAVLVAVQNTAISARTDEAGKFTLSGVPAGQYLTVAAGPVANASSAVAERPNVYVNGGESVDVGTLSLGGPTAPLAIACRVLPGVDAAPGSGTAPPDSP
jgi:hypothetical protein